MSAISAMFELFRFFREGSRPGRWEGAHTIVAAICVPVVMAVVSVAVILAIVVLSNL